MISEFVEYVKQTWKNKPNSSSPLNADRMNHTEDGIENNSKKIKEIVEVVNELTDKIDKALIVREFKSEVTFKLQANSGGQYNTDTSLYPEIKGYTRACIVGARANGSIGIVVYNNSWFYNTTSQEKSFTVTLTWLFVKNGLI